MMIVVVVGYFVIVVRFSDKEYREVIDEKFGDRRLRTQPWISGIILNTRPGLSRFSSAVCIVVDWIKIDTTYSEDLLTSSREGELEAMTEKHKL